MAILRFTAVDIDNREIDISSASSYELSREADAACDALRLCFTADKPTSELKSIRAFLDDELIFNGFVDSQVDSVSQKGFECSIYARSSASILLDNEAEPRGYSCPSTTALFIKNIGDFGFKNRLPILSTEHGYVVGKGVSCYGAINNFVRGMTGRSIAVTPDNELIVPSGDDVFRIDGLDIIGEKRTVARGRLLAEVDYKIDGDMKYSHHMKSRFLESRGISSSAKINLTTLPVWQREGTARNKIYSSAQEYYKIEITALGCVAPRLYDRASGASSLGDMDGYYVTGLCISLDSRGERTKITLCRELELEEISYVAE